MILLIWLFAQSSNFASERGGGCVSCDRQMRKTAEAIQCWRRLNAGTYPASVGELTVAGLSPSGGCVCPDVRSELELASFSHKSQTTSGVGADPFGTYEYELSKRSLRIVFDQLAGDIAGKTRYDLKSRLLRRDRYEEIPILRCPSHRLTSDDDDRWRNLGVNGMSYWSNLYWEMNWLEHVPVIARSEAVLSGLEGPPFISGRESTVPEAIDLSGFINAQGRGTWWWSLPRFDHAQFEQDTPTLGALFHEYWGEKVNFKGVDYWIDGLIQLQGKVMIPRSSYDPGRLFRYPTKRTFPWEKRNIPVNRKFKSASWLQGTVWRTEEGELVAGWLEWNFEDGSSERVAIEVGKVTGRFWANSSHLKDQADYPEPVWSATERNVNVLGDRRIRVFEQTWINPRSDVLVKSVSFVSNRECTAAPFIVAISVSE
jgi:hypothetical protein